MKKEEFVSINEKEAWGGLKNASVHTAAVGARIADNRSRDFGIFGDRITIVGEKKTAEMLRKWVFGTRIQRAIKKNTHFSYYGIGKDANSWSASAHLKGVMLSLNVLCCGEYVQMQAYADRIAGPIDVVPLVDENNVLCWEIVMQRKVAGDGVINENVFGNWPRIYAETKDSAMEMLLDYISNELDGRADIWPV